MKTLSLLLSAIALAAGAAHGQVVFSEVHYHPIEQPDFLADGTPVLDLTDNVHEFVELQNAGSTAADLSGWLISGGIDFSIPSGTTLAPGAFLVVAKDPAQLAAVYGLPPGSVLGPYSGKLSNHGDQLRLRDGTGATRDQMRYLPAFPWPDTANALGAQQRFTAVDSAVYQYRGRSLQRVSTSWSGNDPANWVASPLASGPTPGGPQTVTRSVPKSVVVGLSVTQATDGAAIVRAHTAAKITATFSATDALSGVSLEYFVDDPESFSEDRQVLAMADAGGGAYTATLPAQADRSIVRYRIRADRGSGVEVVSPRDDDAKTAPVGPSGALEAWHAYFVTPVRTDTDPDYDVFVSKSALATLDNNITQTPRRVTVGNATGQPRALPFVASGAPMWNGTQPAVLCTDGEVWDVQLRYHGGFTQRSASRDSYKIHFPTAHPFHGVTSIFETDKDWRAAEGEALVAAAGLPAAATHTVNLYLNDRPAIARLEMAEYNGELLSAFHRHQQRQDPNQAREATGELFKSIGNTGNTGNSTEGPYTRGDFAPIADNAGWPSLARFAWTYAQQNHAWTGPAPLQALVNGMWAARGDTFQTPNLNIAAARAWCERNLDVDSTLTSLALLNWMGAWDDVCQNQYFWRRADGRWTRLPWDFDDLMSSSRVAQSIFVGATGEDDPFFGTNWFKDTVLKCFRDEYRQRLWELNNSLLDPENLSALGLSRAADFALHRRDQVNSQLGLGGYFKPARPKNLVPLDGDAVVTGASLITSSFVEVGGTHAATKWEIRRDDSDYAEPVFVATSTTDKTALSIPFAQLLYGQTYHWRATYLDAAGHPSVASAESSFVWGPRDPGFSVVRLSEILAVNHGAVRNGGETPDYLELHNTGSDTVRLDTLSLTDDPRVPAKYKFPAGVSLSPGGYLVVWCDEDTTAPGLHAGFKLKASGQTVLLLSGPFIVDSVIFGSQVPDYSIGRIWPSNDWALGTPTPGAANVTVPLGSSGAVSINEWMAAPAHGSDWFELYNTARQPVALGGLYLTDKLSAPAKSRISALTFIAPGGFAQFRADDSTGGNHCHFKLSAGGDSIILLAADASTVLNRVTFGLQETNVSQGRLPDGGAHIASFPLTSSPGRSNWRRAPFVVNEVLASAGDPLEGVIELYNPTTDPVLLSAWLSDDPRTPRKYHLPTTVLPANGYLAVYEAQFSGSFSLNPLGGEVILSTEFGGVLSGYRSQVHYGAAPEGRSFGRVPLMGVPDEFWPMAAPTFGVDHPQDVDEFRAGAGAANSAPLIGPVIVNEIHDSPPLVGSPPPGFTQFIEIQNVTANSVDLSGWVLRGAVRFSFAAGASLPRGAYALLVPFDPADRAALADFRAAYPLSSSAPVFGPFAPTLPVHGARIELARPAPAAASTFFMIDRVDYRDSAPWPHSPGQSLQRRSRFQIGNDPANWTVGNPSPAADNVGQSPVAPGASGATISLAAAGSSVLESDAAANIVVTRTGDNAGAVSVGYSTVRGSAFPELDYLSTAGLLTFASGETSKVISVPLVNDNVVEGDESFSLYLYAPTGGAVLGATTTQTITVIDNDLAGGSAVAGEFRFATPSSAASEAMPGPHLVTILRAGGSQGAVSVRVTQLTPQLDLPDATPGQDFAAVLPLSVTFAPGETTKTIAIPILDDTEVEPNERLRLSLSNPDGGAIIGAASIHDIIISSDDVPPLVKPVKAAYTGLINEPFETGGYGVLKLTTGATGALSGRVMANGVAYAFTGAFDAHGEFRRNILARAGGLSAYRTLYLRLATDGSRIDGTLDNEPLSAERNAAAPIAAKGHYTVLLRDSARTAGTMTLNLASSGSIRAAGTLGDGTPFSMATALTTTGRIPICVALYARHAGFVGGAAQLSGGSTPRVVSGSIVWARPIAATPSVPPTLTRTTLALDGAEFVPPARGQRLLPGMTSAHVELLGGGLSAEPSPVPATVSARGQLIIPANPQRLSLQLNARLGTFSGRFIPTDGRARIIRGVVVQRATPDLPTIEGSFPGTSDPGSVRIAAP